MRYYYKNDNGVYYSFKSEQSEREDLIPITEEEFENEYNTRMNKTGVHAG